MKNLTKKLIKDGFLETERIIEAFEKIDLNDFLIPVAKGREGEDAPISIGFGQTISQPSTIAFMFELLQPEKGDKVLDIGSGSGYTSALFAEIVGDEGKVFGLEIIEELRDFAEENVKRNYNFLDKKVIEFLVADGSGGLSKESPFDIIHIAAAPLEIPKNLFDQLNNYGRMVVPVGEYCQEIYLFKKDEQGEIVEEKYPGFAFVPLVNKK